MKRRAGKQLLACLLALAMFATNVDAVYAAPAGAANENGGVQAGTFSEVAPEAGSGTIVRTAPDGRTIIESTPDGTDANGIVDPAEEDEADPADEETTDPAEEIDAEETKEVTETTVSDETTGTTGDEEAAGLPVVAYSGMPERLGDPVNVEEGSGVGGLDIAYPMRAPQNGDPDATGRTAEGGDCWEWSTLGLGEDGETPMGGIVVTIYEAPADPAHETGAAYIWLDNDEEGIAAHKDRERIYTDSFASAAELIRNYELSGYVGGGAAGAIVPFNDGNEFAYKISLDADRQAAYDGGGVCTDDDGHIVSADEDEANRFHVSAADINAVSDDNAPYGGFDAGDEEDAEYDLFDKIACIDLQGNELYIDSNGAPLRLSLPILSTDQPIANGELLYEWYGLGDVQYLCGGRLQIDMPDDSSVEINGAVRVRQVAIFTGNDESYTGDGVFTYTYISREGNPDKNGTFECQDFEYHGMDMNVEGVRFQAGAHETYRYDEHGNRIDADGDGDPDMDSSHVYIGMSDPAYVEEAVALQNGNAGPGRRARIWFGETDYAHEVEGSIPSEVPVASLFGDGVCIGPNVDICADGLQLGHVNIHTEARNVLDDSEIPTGKLTVDRLPRILLTSEDYDAEPDNFVARRTLTVYGSVHSDGNNAIPLLQVGLDLDGEAGPDALAVPDAPGVVFYDEIFEEMAVFAGAHITVGYHEEDGGIVADPTGNPRSVYLVAGEPRENGKGYVNDDLRWTREISGDEETAGMVLEERGEPVLELEYLEGGTITGDEGAFSFRDRTGKVTDPDEAQFDDFNELSDFLRGFDSDIAAVLTVNSDLRDGGNLNISWDREDEQQNRETYGITTLYVVNGMADDPETDEIEAPTIDTSYGNEGMTVFCDRPDVAVYLDDQVKWVHRRFDLRGTGDILYLGGEALTGDTVRDGFIDNMDIYVPCGTIRLGDPHITSNEMIDLNDTRLDASRILVHGGVWRTQRVLVRAGKLKNGSPVSDNLQMEMNAGLLGMEDGGAGMLQIVKYHQAKDSSTPEATSAYSMLTADNIDVIRNVQPHWIEEDGEIEGFTFTGMERDEEGIILPEDEMYTVEEAPEARIVVGGGAELSSPRGINGQSRYIQEPHFDEDENAYVKWDGTTTTNPEERFEVEMLDTDELSPVYASPVLWSDGVVEMESADLYGLVLGADSRTTIGENLHMLTQNKVDDNGDYIEYTEEGGRTRYVTEAMTGSYTWLEGGAALLTQANGSIEFNEPGYLNTGDVRAFVPVSDEEHWYHALHVRGGEPKADSYYAQAAGLTPVLALYLPTLSDPAIGGFALQVGMYEPDEELLDGRVDPVNVSVAFDENGALYYVYQTKEPEAVTLADIERDWTILDTDEEWSAERQKRIQLLKEQTTSSGVQILPVADLTPRFSWWDGTDENGERVGTPNGTLRFGYPFEVYRRVSAVVYDEENGGPDHIDEGYGDHMEGSYLRGFNTWQEAEAYLDSTSDGTAAAKALFELKKTDFGTYEDDQQQTQNILHDDGTIGVPSLEENGNGFEVAWTDRLPVYVVLVGDGVTLGASPAMPSEADRLILEGSSCGNALSFTGTMTLATETQFHGITLEAKTATIHVNDQKLELNWTTGRIGTLKGKKAFETDSSGRNAADGTVLIVAPAEDRFGYDWIRQMDATQRDVDLYITQGISALGTLEVDVQGVIMDENDPVPFPAYPVFVNADPVDGRQWDKSWKPVTVGDMTFRAGEFTSGAMTVENILYAGNETVSVMEGMLTVASGKLTVNGSARIVGNRQVHTSSGDIYIKDFMDMDTQGGIYSAGSLTVDGTVLLGGSYSNADTDRSVTVRADNDITIGDRLISGNKGNQIVYGGKFTVKDVKVLNPWDDPYDDTDPEMKWTLTPNEDETSYKAKDGNPEENDQEAPENAILLVAKKLEKNGVYCYADEDGALAIVTGSVGLYEMNDADDWVTNRLIDDEIAAQALLFADYNNPDYGQSSTYWLTKKRGTGIYVKKSLRVNVLLTQEGSNAGEEYDTLQEALDAIDAKKDKTAVYTVTIDRAAATTDSNKVTPATITGAGTAAEKTTYAAIKLPTNLAGLTVCATASEDPDVNPAVLYTGGDLKAASSLTLDNVQFMRWDNTKGQYATVTAAEPGAKPVTAKVSIASGTLTIAHTVAFDTPVLFDGGGKAAFELAPKDSEIPTALYAGMNYRLTGDTYLDEDGQPVVVLDEFGDPVLAEDENGDPIPVLDENGDPVLDENDDPVYEYVYQTEAAQTVKTALAKRDQLNYGTDQIISTKQRALVDGGFQGFANVTLPGDSTVILSGESAGKSPVFNNIGSFVADEPFFYMIDPVAKPGTAKITNMTMDGGLFVTEGALSVTTLSLGKKAEVAAFGDFKVTGDVINRADSSWSENYATLTTVQKIKATATASTGGSQLTVAGEVVNPDDSLSIRVKLLAGEGSDPQFAQYSPVMLSQQIWPGAECFSKLLTAPKATAEAFAPHPDNVKWNGNSSATAFKINSADHTNEYLVRKEKNDIYVESGSVVEVALAEGIVNEDNSVDDATAIAGASYIGAYKTWKEAVAAVDALKDKEASYTLVLVKDVNCAKTGQDYTFAPAAIAMPMQAAKVKVMSTDAVQDVYGNDATTGVQPHVLCYSGNLTLKQDTDFRHVKFAPYTNAANYNANNQIAAGKYALGLDSCEWIVCPGSITGAKGGSLTVTGAPVNVLKNVSGFTAVNLWEDMSVSLGTFTTDTLTLVGDAVLQAYNGAVTVTDVYTVDGGDNKHGIGFTKSSKGTGKSNLTIKGQVMTVDKPLVLELMKTAEQNQLTDEAFAAQVALKLDTRNPDKVLTDAALQIADIGLTPSMSVKVKIGNTAYGFGMAVPAGGSYIPVKANKSLYLAPIPAVPQNNGDEPNMNDIQAKLLPALTMLQMTPDTQMGSVRSVYLDLSQAVAELDALGNRSWKYQASPGVLAASMYPGLVGEDGVLQVSDTNVTDANRYSPLPLPKKDKADALEIGLSAGYRTELCFTGKLSGSGDVAFKNVVFHPCKAAKDGTVSTFDITMAQNSQLPDGSWPASALRFHSDNAVYDLVPDGTIGKITGVKAVAGKNAATQITFNKTMLTMTTGFAGTADVTLTNAQILTRGANDIGTLTLTQTDTDLATLTSYGNLKLADVNVSGVTDNSKAWIAAKEDTKGNSTISISGNVKTPQDKYLAVQIINKDKKADTKNAELFVTDLEDENNICGFYVTEDDYTNGRKLVLAPVADATAIRALPLLNAPTEGENALSPYKTTDKYVVNGYLYDMMVLVTSYEEDPFTGDAQAVSPVAETYAKTWYEAVQIIENANRPDMSYDVQLIGQGDAIWTGKDVSKLDKITMPSKARFVRIRMSEDSNVNDEGDYRVLQFTGDLAAKCPVEIENIKLQSGTYANGDFTKKAFAIDAGTASLKLSYTKKYEEDGGLEVSGIKGNAVTICGDDVKVSCSGAVSAKELKLIDAVALKAGSITAVNMDQGYSKVESAGDVKVTGDYTCDGAELRSNGDITLSGNVLVEDDSRITGENAAKKVTLGNIYGLDKECDVNLDIIWRLTDPTFLNGKVTKVPVSNLKITGESNKKVWINLRPVVKQSTDQAYYLLSKEDALGAVDDGHYALAAASEQELTAARRIAEMPKMQTNMVWLLMGEIYDHPCDAFYPDDTAVITDGSKDEHGVCILKHGGNLYLTSLDPVVRVEACEDDENGEPQTIYEACFCSLDEAAKEVDRIGRKTGTAYTTDVQYTLLDDIGVSVTRDDDDKITDAVVPAGVTPLAKIPLPKAVRRLTIGGDKAIGFSGGTFALSCDVKWQGMDLIYAKKSGQGYDTTQPFAVNLGSYTLTMEHDCDRIGKITGTGTLDLQSKLTAESVSVKNLNLSWNAELTATKGDITSTGLSVQEDETVLKTPGRITLNDLILLFSARGNNKVEWYAAQPENKGQPVSQITVNGTIRTKDPYDMPEVDADDHEAPIRIYDINAVDETPAAGTVIATAPKASDTWFCLNKSEGKYSTYKSGKMVVYNPNAYLPVSLVTCYTSVDRTGTPIEDEDAPMIRSDFKTLNEAFKEIDALGLTMQPGRDENGKDIVLDKGVKLPYERYTILLNNTVSVRNAPQKEELSALALPSKTARLTIESAHDMTDDDTPDLTAISFAGDLSLKSDLVLDDRVQLVSMKCVTVNGKKINYPTPAAYKLGAYRMTIARTDDDGFRGGLAVGEASFYDGISPAKDYFTIGNVTATAGKGGLILKNGSDNLDQIDRQLRVRIAGTLNSDVELGPDTMLTVGGAATVGTLTFDATDWGQIAPAFAADKALTLGAVVQHADMTKSQVNRAAGKIWKKDLSTPVTVKGTKVNGETVSVIRDSQGADLAPCVKLYLGTAASVPAGTKAATGPGLSVDDWDLYAGDLSIESGYYSYNGYVYKNALYVGTQNLP